MLFKTPSSNQIGSNGNGFNYKKIPPEISRAGLVDLKGFEPTTSRMRTERSPN